MARDDDQGGRGGHCAARGNKRGWGTPDEVRSRRLYDAPTGERSGLAQKSHKTEAPRGRRMISAARDCGRFRQRARRVIARSSAPLLLAAMLGGCSAPKTVDYTPTSGSASSCRTVAHGLELCADPVTDAARSKRLFGIDSAKRGVLPVHVEIRNLDNDGTWLIEQTNMRLRRAGEEALPRSIEKRNRAAEVYGPAGPILLSGPLLFAGTTEKSKDLKVTHEFARKELPLRQTLARGGAYAGFVYFPVPKGERNLSAKLLITATEVATKETITLELDLTP